MKILDLSQAVTNQTPVYPGDPPVQIEEAGKIATDGFSAITSLPSART